MARGRHGDSAGGLLVGLGFAISIQLAADDRARPGAQTGPYHGTGLAAGFAAHNGASPAVASSRCGGTDGSACRAANDGACLAAEFSSDGCTSRASYTATYSRLRCVPSRGDHG